MYPAETEQDAAFDLEARAQLAQVVSPEHVPPKLFRHGSWWTSAPGAWISLGLALGLVVGSLFLAVRPPALVRSAIEHEVDERTLRGVFMEPQALLALYGLDASKPVPGFPQLLRTCELAGTRAYHLTTFFEKGGMVTAFGFDAPQSLKLDHGWWFSSYWQVMTTPSGRTLLLVAQKKAALAAAQKQFLSHAA
jgi:hypothetical protein